MDQCHSGLKSLGTIVDGSLSNPVTLSASKAGRFVGDSLSSNKLGYHCSSTNMAYSKTAAANTEPITAGPGRTFVTDSHASGLVFFFFFGMAADSRKNALAAEKRAVNKLQSSGPPGAACFVHEPCRLCLSSQLQ
jgi:hypothetical protein